MTWPSRRSAIALGAIVLVALGARLAWALWTTPEPTSFSDAQYYDAAARSIAGGHGYSVFFDFSRGFLSGGEATAFWPPGYSFFLGVAYAIFGDSLAVARVANVVVGGLTVIPIYIIGQRLFGERAAMAGAAIGAVLPSLVFWTPVLLSETFFVFLFACGLAAIVATGEGAEAPSAVQVVGVGLLIAMATLVRGPALVLLPTALVWWWIAGLDAASTLRSTVLASLVVVAVLVPWSVRNAAVMDSPIAVSTNAGYNLRIGHAPYSTGRYLAPPDLWEERPGISFQERELFFNDVGRERAWAHSLDHPGREAELAGRKIVALWQPDSDALDWVSDFGHSPLPDGAHEPLRLLLDVTYLAVLGTAAASLALGWRDWRGLAFVLVVVAFWTAVHVVFFGEPRYHLPLLVILAPMAGAALATLRARLGGGRTV